MSSELLQKSAVEQARFIAGKKLSSRELVTLYLKQIKKGNPDLQAFVDVYAHEALATADKKDRETSAGGKLPPFHGVPIGIKDLNMMRGKRTRFGSLGSIPLWSPMDDLNVANLRRAGFVILGKLATSELGALPVTEPWVHPPTRNPWNRDHTSGGSSGGSATAVAGGMLPVAHGSDGGGSIRIPASFTGLVGLKPARGRVRNAFGFSDRQILYTSGALTRTVEDSAAMLDVMSGFLEGKTHWAQAPARRFSDLSMEVPKKLKIRLTLESPIVKTDPEVREATLRTAQQLRDLGHEVNEQQAPQRGVDDFLPLWQHLMGSVPLWSWKRAKPVTRWLHEAGLLLKVSEIQERHLQLERELLAWFGDIDLWLTPCVSVLPPRVGQYPENEKNPAETFYQIAGIGAFTAFANVTGQPAISVPAGLSKSGLPIGIQLVAQPQNETLLLQVARQLEVAQPWLHRF